MTMKTYSTNIKLELAFEVSMEFRESYFCMVICSDVGKNCTKWNRGFLMIKNITPDYGASISTSFLILTMLKLITL